MKILIDIGHPADVHTFSLFAQEMQKKGHEIFFTVREKEVNIDLLIYHSFHYYKLGRIFGSLIMKAFGLFIFNIRLLFIVLKKKPNIILSHGSMYAAQIAWVLGKTHIALQDTGSSLEGLFYLPFTKIVLAPELLKMKLGKKGMTYSGYHELAYLHPRRFVPNQYVLKKLGFNNGEIVVLFRFVLLNATHDLGSKGISYDNRIKAIKEFSKFGKVFISSQGPLPVVLEKYRLPLHPTELHNFIACCSLVFGESATVTSEAAVLGVPAIYVDKKGTCYTHEEEQKYGLVFNFTESKVDQEKAIQKGIELLSTPGLREEWQRRRQRMLADKIDVTAFFVWFIENYPESAQIMRENPDYQLSFK